MAFKVGLALGGGAARGLAHLGVIKALRDDDIPIDIITGTSIGAIVATAYGADPTIEGTIKKVAEYLDSPDFDKTRLELLKESAQQPSGYFEQIRTYLKTGLFFAASIRHSSFISEETFRKNLEFILPSGRIEDFPVKTGLVSMNLDTAREEISTSGEVIEKVMASCAIPGIFPPVVMNGESYVDGSWINPVPVSAARRLGAKFVIAVDVAPALNRSKKNLSGFDISLKAAEASRMALKEHGLKDADVALNVDLMDIHWADFTRWRDCIDEGERVVEQYIEEIRKKLFWKKLKTAWRS